ncbi:MAG: hypothetical protein EOP54_25985, partial [Sphingobacteriales bacterium]
MFKERNFLSKYWLKYTDRGEYITYKYDLANYKKNARLDGLVNSDRLTDIKKIKSFADEHKQLNLIHSGNAGDIIYALATIKKMQEITAVPINLYFKLGQPLLIDPKYTHPLGNVMLNQKMVDMLHPLISSQPYINNCESFINQRINIDMDYFRSGVVPLDKGNIARWCSYITGINPQLWKKWLFVEPDTTYADTIVIARSERYRNHLIDHSFLNKYPNKVFIGVQSEYKDMKKMLPDLKLVEVTDFLQMARIIAGCKFFIGNQSFPFAIAEALKVPRILEPSFDVINVVPEGEDGYDFFFQSHFES